MIDDIELYLGTGFKFHCDEDLDTCRYSHDSGLWVDTCGGEYLAHGIDSATFMDDKAPWSDIAILLFEVQYSVDWRLLLELGPRAKPKALALALKGLSYKLQGHDFLIPESWRKEYPITERTFYNWKKEPTELRGMALFAMTIDCQITTEL